MGTLKPKVAREKNSRSRSRLLGGYKPDPAQEARLNWLGTLPAADNRFVETVITCVLDTQPEMIREKVRRPLVLCRGALR